MEPSRSLRVVTFNTKRLRAGPRALAVADFLRNQRADVVALQEVSEDAAESIARHAGFRHCTFAKHARRAQRGVALLHRLDARERGGARLPARWGDDKGFVRIVLSDASHGDLEVIALHLDWLSRRARTKQIEALASLLPEARRRVVLGDMNAMSFGACIRRRVHDDTTRELGNALGVEPRGAHRTFPSRSPVWALDWILASPALHIADVRVDVPSPRLSDHAALSGYVSSGET